MESGIGDRYVKILSASAYPHRVEQFTNHIKGIIVMTGYDNEG